MADNTKLPLGTEDGDTYASDDISGIKHQRVKVTLGADNTSDGDVSSSNPMPVTGPLTDTQLRASAVNTQIADPIIVGSSGISIGKDEDQPSFDGDTGSACLAVRKASPANTSDTEGDYEFLQMNAGRLWVDASGKTLDVNITGGASSGTEYTEDAAAAANPAGGMLIVRRKDTLSATEVSTDGDNIAVNSTAKGEIYVKQTDVVHVDDNSSTLSVDDGAGSITVDNAGTFAVQAAIADGASVTLGSKADAKNAATDTTSITAMSVLKQISASVQAPPSQAVTNAGTFAVQAAATEADGANVTLGAKADAKSTATDTTPITAMSVLKQISASVQAPPSQAVTNAGTFAVQAAATEADGANVTLGAKADAKSTATDATSVSAMSVLKQISASVQASTNLANTGAFAVQATIADGLDATLGAKADAKSTATDTTAVTAMSVLKQISASVQAPPSQAVTNAGTFAVQATEVAATIPTVTTMQNAATATGNGSSLNVQGYSTAVLNVLGITTATITFEGSVDDTTWVWISGGPPGGIIIGDGTTTAINGDFRLNVAGYKSLRARISAYTSGTITVKGYAIASPGGAINALISDGGGTIGIDDNGTTISIDDGAGNISIDDGGNSITVDNAGTFAVQESPNASSTFSPTNATSTSYEASRVIKGGNGVLFCVTGYNSKTSAQFIQLHDASSLPADTAVPVLIFTIPASSNFSLDFGGKFGRFFSTGITICNSSTGPTKTIGSADCWFDAQYK